MGIIDSLFKGGKHYPRSVVKSVTQSAEALYTIVNESIQLAGAAPDLDTKKKKLEFAMKKLVELIKLANEYSFLDFRKISTIYDSIREVRNEIRELELLKESGSDAESENSEQSEAVFREKPRVSVTSKDGAICPYCDYQFPVMPQRKSPCPSCNKMIYVWYSTTQNMKKLITKEDALKIEREIAEHIEQYEMLNKQQTLDKSEDEMKELQAELQVKDPTATLDDTYLFLLNNKIKQSLDNGEKSSLLYLKAMILDSSGKDFFPDLLESKKLELLNLKTNEYIKKVQIITNPESCHKCKIDSDKVLDIDQALKSMPLPHKDCERPLQGDTGFCRCTYLIVNE
ncbi:MAG: hypothetical protein IPH88_02550 [Bacteroidales bacterium]|nr:hypothetical protein [Bacteroidales bacterium]